MALEPHLIFQQEQQQLQLRFLFSKTLLELLQLVVLLTLQLEELHQQLLPTTLFHLEEQQLLLSLKHQIELLELQLELQQFLLVQKELNYPLVLEIM